MSILNIIKLIKSQEQNERLTTLVGKVTVEKEWLAKKLKSIKAAQELI
jgi:putative transposase